MKPLPSFFAFALAALATLPVLARADVKPNFEDDAKPILSQQPGLIEYVESKYQVKGTGIAKVPGNDDRAPQPPYIFRARARGSSGPYNLRLLIQPGPPGHILGIVKDSPTQPVATTKSPTTQTATPQQQAPNSAPQIPALTADSPSGPVTNSAPPAVSNSSSLPPPSDPAPAPH